MDELNENDQKLLIFCRDTERSVNEIARHLNIASKNVSVRLKKLSNLKLININKKGNGKKTLIRTKEGDKTKEYMLKILGEIKKRGSVTFEEYSSLLPLESLDIKEKDKLRASLTLQYINPKLIEKRILLTPEGEKFLKENSK